MFWKKKGLKRTPKNRSLSMACRALFTGGCFAAFAIFGWGVETGTVIELIIFLILVVVAMIVPAAIFVALLKFISYKLKKVGKNDE